MRGRLETVHGDVETGKLYRLSSEPEFSWIKHHSIVYAVFNVVERVPEGLFYVVVSETAVVNASYVSLFVGSDIVEPSCVGVSGSVKSLRTSANRYCPHSVMNVVASFASSERSKLWNPFTGV